MIPKADLPLTATLEDLVAEWGVHRSTVLRTLARYGVTPANPGHKPYRYDMGAIAAARERALQAPARLAQSADTAATLLEAWHAPPPPVGSVQNIFTSLTFPERQRLGEAMTRGRDAMVYIGEAVAHFLEWRGSARRPTVEEAAAECWESRKLAGARHRYLQALKCTFGQFVRRFAGKLLCDITAPDIEGWLGSEAWTADTRRSYLTDIRTLYSFAQERHYVAHNPALAVPKPRREDKPPGIFTVTETAQLLRTAHREVPGLLAFLAVGLFAGLRTSELLRLNWSEVRDGFVEVTAAKSKTRQRRLVEIQPVLEAWLEVARDIGSPLPPVNYWRLFDVLREKSGVPWVHNAMRHSFASYHLAKFRSQDRTATELGHYNTHMLFAHYRALVRPADAQRYFGLTPEAVGVGCEGEAGTANMIAFPLAEAA